MSNFPHFYIHWPVNLILIESFSISSRAQCLRVKITQPLWCHLAMQFCGRAKLLRVALTAFAWGFLAEKRKSDIFRDHYEDDRHDLLFALSIKFTIPSLVGLSQSPWFASECPSSHHPKTASHKLSAHSSSPRKTFQMGIKFGIKLKCIPLWLSWYALKKDGK